LWEEQRDVECGILACAESRSRKALEKCTAGMGGRSYRGFPKHFILGENLGLVDKDSKNFAGATNYKDMAT
jgi:hypothetical protein